MKTLKDYLEETIRRYGAVGSSRGMGYTLENDQLDEILGPDQLSKLQSIKSQLPKVGGQKPSVPTDADRAEADAWLAGLKGGTSAAAPVASGDAPINFDRPGRPRSVSHGELQNKIAKLKSIKGLLKSISKMEPRATRAANKVGGSEEIATKSQMMQDMINNLKKSNKNQKYAGVCGVGLVVLTALCGPMATFSGLISNHSPWFSTMNTVDKMSSTDFTI